MVLVDKFNIRFASGDITWHWLSHWKAWRQTGWKLLFGSKGGGSNGGLFIICLLTFDYAHPRRKKRKNVKQTYSIHSVVIRHSHWPRRRANGEYLLYLFLSNRTKVRTKKEIKQWKSSMLFARMCAAAFITQGETTAYHCSISKASILEK